MRRPLARLHVIAVTAALVSAAVLLGWGTSSSSSAAPPSGAGFRTRCAADAPVHVLPTGWPAARRRLAPAGARSLELCRYTGLNGHPPLRLVRSRRLTDARLVRKLVAEFDRLPSFPKGAFACPIDDGSQILARLSYAEGRIVTISVGLTGCASVTNGKLTRTAMGLGMPPQVGPRLIAQLKHLASAPED